METLENNIGSLEWVSGHTYDTIYDLVFTTERVIAVIIQHPNDTIYKFGVAGMLLGGKLAGGNDRLQRFKIAEARRRDYKQKSFDELVDSHRFNFEIPYRRVISVEIRRGLFKSRLKFRISRPSIPEHSIQFTFAKGQHTNARDLLDQVLPSKVNGK